MFPLKEITDNNEKQRDRLPFLRDKVLCCIHLDRRHFNPETCMSSNFSYRAFSSVACCFSSVHQRLWEAAVHKVPAVPASEFACPLFDIRCRSP